MSEPMGCAEVEELLHERLDGTAAPQRAVLAEQHLRECRRCAALSGALQTLVAGLASLPPADVDDATWESIAAAAAASGIRRRAVRRVAVPTLVAAAALACWAVLCVRHHASREPVPPPRAAPTAGLLSAAPTPANPSIAGPAGRPTAPERLGARREPAAASRPRARSGRRDARPPQPPQQGTATPDDIVPPEPGPSPDLPEWLSTPEGTALLAREVRPLPGPDAAEDEAEMRLVLLAVQAEASLEFPLLAPPPWPPPGGPAARPDGDGPPVGESGRSG